MPEFGKRSLEILAWAHLDLQRLFREVVKEFDCTIDCSFRNEQEQNEAYKRGASKAKWLQSPHNFSPSLAVDVVPWPTRWADKQKQKELYGIVKIKAVDLGIDIECGGDWPPMPNGDKDWPHFQMANWKNLI
jgi:peptidoglycan L-alanyl-D-glutamate endopeptidase CwlK